jgi:ankyrin repeat protein
MSRKLTPASTLENLRREAKRWLKALRAGDAAARARLERAWSDSPAHPTLRNVQHALAREHGFDGWAALKAEAQRVEARRGSARELAVTRLLEAAGRGDAATVNSMLDAHPDIIDERAVIPGHTGLRTALHHAVTHRDVVESLLERGADPNVRDEGDNAMPLHFAAERDDLAVIRLLIEHGADPIGAGDFHQLDVIGWATCFGKGNPEVVSYLLEHGARHNIFSAVAMGDIGAIRTLAAATRGDIDAAMDRTNHRRRPLHLAVVKKRVDSLAALLELGADTEAVDAAGLTPLDQAALDGDSRSVRRLLDHGATLQLPAAIALGRGADVEALLRQDPQALKPGGRWGTLIVRASERGSADLIRALLRAGASVDVRDDTSTAIDGATGYTPLHAAAFHGNTAAAEVLLEHGADPNLRDGKYCGTPAGWARYAGHHAVCDLILAGRIDPFQAIDHDLAHRIPGIVQRDPWLLEKRFGEYAKCARRADQWWPEPWHTPLWWAVHRNKADAVRALLEQGAVQPLAGMPGHQTLVQIAQEAGHDEVARLLREHQHVERTHEGRVRWFVKNACPDHDIRGGPAHVIARHTAERMLKRHPEIATDSFQTAIICGDLPQVQRVLAERPEAARAKGGPKGWDPLLYLCFTRLPSRAAAADHAVAMARALLDHGADPNAFFMAGDSRYTPLVGVIGEGEEDRPAHPRREELARLLLERGAEPYDVQVLYDIHFRGEVLWFLELIYDHSVRLGRRADWDDPEWRMLDMGGYGTGARYLLEIAVRKNDVALADWLLSHGANPDAAHAADPRLPQVTLHEAAVRAGHLEMADLLVRNGATPSGAAIDDAQSFVAACLRLDRDRAEVLLAEHPEYLRSTAAMFAAAESDRADVVALLLDLGVSIEVENQQHQRTLHAAAWSDAVRVAELLLERGAEVDPRENEWQNTPLDFAVYHQHRAMIELLCRHSRDIWNLVFVGRVDRVRDVLRDEPALAQSITSRNETPLTWLPDDEGAALAIAELFLAHGADAGIRDHDGLSAADHASRRGLVDAAALLLAQVPPG